MVLLVQVDAAGGQQMAQADDAPDAGAGLPGDHQQSRDLVLGHAVGERPQGLVGVRGDRRPGRLPERDGVGGIGVDRHAAGDDTGQLAVRVQHRVQPLGEQSLGIARLVRGAQQGGDLPGAAVGGEGDPGGRLRLPYEMHLERVGGGIRHLRRTRPGRPGRGPAACA
ncbi:hypothetical protein FB563_0308 [Streptomyces puniciscabiei]|uniref:Uncharacterized protein n=1 Tax=Streptomyces puniciscabiei TaxID=164348 RepID=A0A542U8N6_9ACTN|nr:hypothetical protein FB563_0308 [Streptomyces puniciscabiei]